MPLAAGERFHLCYHAVDDQSQINGAESDRARILPRAEGEQVVDDIGHPVEFFDVAFQRLFHVLLEFRVKKRHFAVRLDDRERRAQFVGDIADEALLRCERLARGGERHVGDEITENDCYGNADEKDDEQILRPRLLDRLEDICC